jgi:hypothetical protein
MPQELQEFTFIVVSLPLAILLGTDSAASADLISEAVHLSFRETVGELIYLSDEIHCFLPSNQIFEVLRHQLFSAELGTGSRLLGASLSV